MAGDVRRTRWGSLGCQRVIQVETSAGSGHTCLVGPTSRVSSHQYVLCMRSPRESTGVTGGSLPNSDNWTE